MALILTRTYCGKQLENTEVVVEPDRADEFAVLPVKALPGPEISHLSFEKRIASLFSKHHGQYATCAFQYRVSIVSDEQNPETPKYIIGIHRIKFVYDA